MNNLLSYRSQLPCVGQNVWIADNARLIGCVTVGDESSIWFGCVLRGDINRVEIGRCTNIQDGSICHVADDHACVVGDFVTAGHNVILHGCIVGHETLVGMGAILMNGVKVGSQCIIGAGSLLTEGMTVPDGSLVYGSPARVVSHLDQNERPKIAGWARKYCQLAKEYRREEMGRTSSMP